MEYTINNIKSYKTGTVRYRMVRYIVVVVVVVLQFKYIGRVVVVVVDVAVVVQG